MSTNRMSAADAKAAAFIAEHRLRKQPLPQLPAEFRPRELADGYRVQTLANDRLIAAGFGAAAGHKVGATNPVVQQALHVPHAVAGVVFANTVHHIHARLAHTDYVRPGVECEVVALIGSDLPPRPEPYTRLEVASAIAACAAGIEIIDDRYVDVKALGAACLIADNGLDAGAVIGKPVDFWQDLNLPACSATITVNGNVVAQGVGADVMGDPINVVVWLANDLARRGLGLRAGEFVFTGSMTPIVWAQPGDEIAISIAKLGAATCRFS